MPAVHPHVRGARALFQFPPRGLRGPSPRGARRVVRPPCRPESVHPHVRGARCFVAVLAGRKNGPSPRAWGSALCPRDSRGPGRSIPTCVGLGTTAATTGNTWSVHPHVRGARSPNAARVMGSSGPSPRAWGSEAHLGPDAGGVRSIPTCVGLGDSATASPSRSRSSPRAWGSGFSSWHVHPSFGPSPCVGLGPRFPFSGSTFGPSGCVGSGVPYLLRITHPQSIPTCVGLGVSSAGSGGARSIPTRGARDRWPSRGRDRSIPTCVGLGTIWLLLMAPYSVHPHVRGARPSLLKCRNRLFGPSPRAWGSDFPTCANFHRYRYAIKTTGATREPVTIPSPFVAAPMATATPLLSSLRTRNTGWQH